MMWIILAWCETSREPVEGTGRPDIGLPPDWKDIRIPKAATWLIDGDASDLAKAKAYGEKQDPPAVVFAYPSTERDPLARARRDVLAVGAS